MKGTILCCLRELAVEKFGRDVWENVLEKAGMDRESIMLMKADVIHDVATKMMRNAAPPRFIYVEKDKKTLLMTYNSSRNMMPFFLGLIKGVGKYFNEDLTLNVISSNQVEITFP